MATIRCFLIGFITILVCWINHHHAFDYAAVSRSSLATIRCFLIGFITILVCWINHHHAFDYIDKVDSGFMWVNGFLLFLVTLTPFPTPIVAEFLEKEGKIALAAFGLNYFLIAIAAYFICAYPYNKFLIEPGSRNFFYYVKLTYAYSIGYTLIAFIVCFISIPAAIVLYTLMFFVFAFPKEFAKRLMRMKERGRSKNQT